MATFWYVNRYDWLAQKLSSTLKHEDITWLHSRAGSQRLISHLDFVHGVSQVKAGYGLDDLIQSLQQSPYDKIPQNFLLLCQSLLYKGQHDSVVALCRQFLGKEIDLPSSSHGRDDLAGTGLNSTQDNLESIDSELYRQIKSNSRLNNPKFWLIFAQCLEYQRKFKDADQAYKVALMLNSINLDDQVKSCVDIGIQSRYSKFNLQQTNDLRGSLNVLDISHPEKRSVAPTVALIHSISRPLTYSSQIKRSLETIQDAERSYMYHQNPSAEYNNLSRLCSDLSDEKSHDLTDCKVSETERKIFELTIAKSHLVLNLSSADLTSRFLYNVCQDGTPDGPTQDSLSKVDHILNSIGTLKLSACSSAALWNNLGLSYLLKKRYIPCLSCLLRAQHIEPLDWRISYNLAITYANIGLISKAFVHFLASRGFNSTNSSQRQRHGSLNKGISTVNSCLKSFLALCSAEMHDLDESRQLHIESQLDVQQASVLSKLNYLIFLHKYTSADDDQAIKIKLTLLDQLEQSWLQRNQNNPQFNRCLLEAASSVALDMIQHNEMKPRIFAWAKVELR